MEPAQGCDGAGSASGALREVPADQIFQIRKVEGLLDERGIGIPPRYPRRPVAGDEDERKLQRPQPVGQRIDVLAPELDVEDGAVQVRRLRLEEVSARVMLPTGPTKRTPRRVSMS